MSTAGESPDVLAETAQGPEGPWCLVGLCNWAATDDSRAVSLDSLGIFPGPGDVIRAYEAWTGRATGGWAGTVGVPKVEGHSVAVLAIRVRPAGQASLRSSKRQERLGDEVNASMKECLSKSSLR
jgi:hypothetical protein